jgi:hypothetical protein
VEGLYFLCMRILLISGIDSTGYFRKGRICVRWEIYKPETQDYDHVLGVLKGGQGVRGVI